MITKNIRSLLDKLNEHMSVSLHQAAAYALSLTHHKLYPDHLLVKLLENPDGDIPIALRHFGLDPDEIILKVTKNMERFQAGNTDIPRYSMELLEILEASWLLSSLHFGTAQVRSIALLEALLDDPRFSSSTIVAEASEIDLGSLRSGFKDILSDSLESVDTPSADQAGTTGPAPTPGVEAGTALDLYTINLTETARTGGIDTVSGRDDEIRQVMDILTRRRKNNPILVGEAGVGKTAVVEGLALRIAQGDVVDSLKSVDIYSLDLGMLQAGASVKGEFEKRLKGVISQIVDSGGRRILFIDEAHTLIGAGGAAGSGDAANLLKPPLARGELRTLGATTFSEYKKYIEKDPALERRFQVVKVDEPDEETCCTMLRGIKGVYESHHNVTISDSAVRAAVAMSKRYIAGRQLPDKAVDVLDTASARVRMSQSGTPASIDSRQREANYLEQKLAHILSDREEGFEVEQDDITECEDRLKVLREEITDFSKDWDKQRQVVEKIVGLIGKKTDDKPPAEDQQASEADRDNSEPPEDEPTKETEVTGKSPSNLAKYRKELAKLQESRLLVLADVDERAVASVVSDWTGVPLGEVFKDKAASLLDLEVKLGQDLVGQDKALAAIADTIRLTSTGVGKQDTPRGVFLLVGPSGVGKTETARLVARELLGDERFMTTINMSEYQEKHTVSQLKGSPPGYVGYGEGGVLTEAVRRRPYSVVLLDEVEKAHRDVMNIFYQVFDKGIMRDGEGREIDFKNTIIMMTSNIGSDTILDMCEGSKEPSADELVAAIRPELIDHFQTALLARMEIVPYFALGKEALSKIVHLKLAAFKKRLAQSHRIEVLYGDDLIDVIISRSSLTETGARDIEQSIQREMLVQVARGLSSWMIENDPPKKLSLGTDADGKFTFGFE